MKVLKCKNKGDVLFFFTKHSAKWLLKSSIDSSDQMIAYSSPLYRPKLVVELLLNTCIINAMVLFEQVIRRNIEIPDFRIKFCIKRNIAMVKLRITFLHNLLKKSRHEMKEYPKITMTTSPEKISSQVFILTIYNEFVLFGTRIDFIDTRVIFLYEFKLDDNAAITTHTINQSLMEMNSSVTAKQPAVRMKDTFPLLKRSKNE
ncbi:LOW QUALITY PROTEIN: piggyBac transposable element-derived protein 4-like [Vespula maculifrons]|uniref:PiggyBac transposable element-derived protein 4-like n=1 Tax=Vespula maculifrons TaxID=7453 RepID=A0ABD2ASM5_VESMC